MDEKIDIIQWNADQSKFLESALAPAKIDSIELSGQRAKITVQEDQAPLAIGRGGVNVNLASKLTGFEIDIEQIKSATVPESVPTQEEPVAEEPAETPQEAVETTAAIS